VSSEPDERVCCSKLLNKTGQDGSLEVLYLAANRQFKKDYASSDRYRLSDSTAGISLEEAE